MGGHFSAGGDFHEVSRLRAQGPAALRPLFETFIGACELIAQLPVPVVAAVEGYAMAGGFELVQSVDIALVRDDAVLADNHVNFGMIRGGGGSQRLPRIVGLPRALGHIMTGDRLTGAEAAAWGPVYRSSRPPRASDIVPAAESAKFMSGATGVRMAPDAGSPVTLAQIVGVRKALEIFLTNPTLTAADAKAIGLVTRVVADDMLHEEALRLARSPAAGAPRALAATKRLVWSGPGGRVEAQLPEEARTVAGLSGTADALAGLAAVIERREPRFTGR